MKFIAFLFVVAFIYGFAGLFWFLDQKFAGTPSTFHEVLLYVLVGWVASESADRLVDKK